MNRGLSISRRLGENLSPLLLVVAVLWWLSGSVAKADMFEDSPPVWEPLLWGGRPVVADKGDLSGLLVPPAIPTPDTDDSISSVGKANSEGKGSHASDNVGHFTSPHFSEIVPPSTPVFVGLRDRVIARVSTNELSTGYYRAPYKSLWLKNIPPLYVTPELPGEGIWQSQGMPTGPDGQPVMYRTSYRPSAQYANAIVHMLLFDMKHISMDLFIGSSEPGGSERTSTIEREDRPNLVAITNALWKQKHSGEGGTIFRGQVLKKLAPGLATIVAYKDGSVDILEWNEGIPVSLISDAKQLRHLIVRDGKVVDHIVNGGKQADSEIGLGYLLSENESDPNAYWYGYGGVQPQANFGADWFIATRSAFGIRADGNLVFAAGYHISTKDLAKALVLAGCERAIHGDANPHNVLGNIYQVGGDGIIARKFKLSPDQKTYTLDRYVDRSYTSDYFGFFISRAERDPS